MELAAPISGTGTDSSTKAARTQPDTGSGNTKVNVQTAPTSIRAGTEALKLGCVHRAERCTLARMKAQHECLGDTRGPKEPSQLEENFLGELHEIFKK